MCDPLPALPSPPAPPVLYRLGPVRCRAGPMLQRVVQLAEETAKWEAEEKERQRLEGLRAKRQAAGMPSMRPLMIRTGKAKTDGAPARCPLAALGVCRVGVLARLSSGG